MTQIRGKCWLQLGVGLVAVTTSICAAQTGDKEQKPLPDILMADGRLTVEMPRAPLKLGEPNRIRITLRGPELQSLNVVQGSADGQELVVQHSPDGSLFVQVIPVALGTVEFEFFAAFVDGGFLKVDAKAEVVPGRPPQRLILSQGGIPGQDAKPLMTVGQQTGIFAEAEYDGLKQSILIPGTAVQFTVRQTPGLPAVRFDAATGMVDALRLGDAYIEAQFAGAAATVCVRVNESEWDQPGDCEELKSGGNGMLPTQEGADAPGASAGSRLPYTAVDDGRRGRFLVDERVEIVPPADELNVAEENLIRMRVHAGTVVRVECLDPMTGCAPRRSYREPGGKFHFDAQKNDEVGLRVFASNLGEQEFNFLVFFADGGVARTKVKATVGLGTKPPLKINESCGSDSYPSPFVPVHLVMPGNGERYVPPPTNLWINACYDGIPGFVVLPADAVTYRVWSDGTEPAIRVDGKTGQPTPLRPGQALLEREFRGVKSETCVVVDERLSLVGDLSNCRALRAAHGAELPRLKEEQEGKVVGQREPRTLHEVEVGRLIERLTLSPDVKDRFDASERLEFPLEGVTLPLGKQARLPVRVHGPEILRTRVFQKLVEFKGEGIKSYYDLESSDRDQFGTVELAEDGTTWIRMVARRNGTAEFEISVLFADGGIAERVVRVPVRVDGKPVKLANAIDGSQFDFDMEATTLHMLTTVPENQRHLFPVARLDENGWLVRLAPGDVTFAVKQADDPVIRLDAVTGTVTGLRVGHALVTTQFAGAKSETCVVVMADLVKGDPSNCEELRGNQ